MRVAFLLGANPRSHQAGANTILKPGKWRVVGENVVDSDIVIKNHSLQFPLGDEFELIEYIGLRAVFLTRGKETSISVFAERI